jgi:TetR/AcrR family transcriptional regulator, lmrAB and yxaGH operons repressor
VASDTRDRLIRTTSRLLREQGYAATGLNQVMAEADAPKGSMYFHFPGGKEELGEAAVDHFAAQLTARMTDGLARGTVRQAVRVFFDAYIEVMERTEFRLGCAVASVALDEAATHDRLAEAAGRAFRTWVDLMADALESEGRAADRSHDLATLIIGSIEGAIVMAKGQRSSEPLASARDALDHLLAGPTDPTTTLA